MEVYLRQTDLDSYGQVLSEIKSKEIRNLIVDTKAENMHHFLRMVNPYQFFHVLYPNEYLSPCFNRTCFITIYLQILQLQMNDYNYHYLFTTFVS